MKTPGYRLWQSWQQMHYPIRGLPESEVARSALLAIDGTAGPILEGRFCVRLRRDGSPEEWRNALEQCELALDRLDVDLTGDARRYFGRLHSSVGIVLHDDDRSAKGRSHVQTNR